MPNTIITKELREEFMKVVEAGDEAAARTFLIDHLKEFPPDMQDAITVAFLEEALVKKNTEDGLISDFQTKGLAALDVLGKAKEELEKHAKLAEIKESV